MGILKPNNPASPPLRNGSRPLTLEGLARDVQDLAADATVMKISHPGEGGDLPPGRWERLDDEFHQLSRTYIRDMHDKARWLIGYVWLPVVAVLSTVGLLWIFPTAELAQSSGNNARVHWWGPDFTATPTTSMLLAMTFAAMAGSVVQSGVVFSMRAGRRTLERGYEAWYWLRPIVSGLLGMLFGLAVLAGVLVVGADATTAGPEQKPLNVTAMVSLGALAGLFTDRVLQSMQRILGATDPDHATQNQATPGTPDA